METAPETLTPKAALLDVYPPARVFAIISWGAAATSWLAWALNAHPDIYCVHAANHFWNVLGNAPRLDGVEYIQLLSRQGSAHRVAGDVHGVSRHLVPAIRKAFGDAFRSAVVIRDPLPRLRSQYALMNRYKEYHCYDVSYVDGLIDRLNLPVAKDDFDRKLSVHGINMLNAIVEEVAVGPVFKSEELTSDSQALERLIHAIAGQDTVVDAQWCQRIVASPPRNSHRRHETDILSEPWFRDLISRVVRPEAWELYHKYGYEPPAFLKSH